MKTKTSNAFKPPVRPVEKKVKETPPKDHFEFFRRTRDVEIRGKTFKYTEIGGSQFSYFIQWMILAISNEIPAAEIEGLPIKERYKKCTDLLNWASKIPPGLSEEDLKIETSSREEFMARLFIFDAEALVWADRLIQDCFKEVDPTDLTIQGKAALLDFLLDQAA